MLVCVAYDGAQACFVGCVRRIYLTPWIRIEDATKKLWQCEIERNQVPRRKSLSNHLVAVQNVCCIRAIAREAGHNDMTAIDVTKHRDGIE